jgi:glucan-binding YG repeat protein
MTEDTSKPNIEKKKPTSPSKSVSAKKQPSTTSTTSKKTATSKTAAEKKVAAIKKALAKKKLANSKSPVNKTIAKKKPEQKSTIKKATQTKTGTTKKAVAKTKTTSSPKQTIPKTARKTTKKKTAAPKAQSISPESKTTRKKTIPKSTSTAKKTIGKTTVKTKSTTVAKKSVLKKNSPKRGFGRSDTISKIYYRIAKKELLKRNVIRGILILFPIFILAWSISWYWNDRIEGQIIMRSVDQGLIDLENDRIEEATTLFQRALDRYSLYHIKNPALWRQRDNQMFSAMLRTTHAWRSLGNYYNGLLAFQLVAQHDSKGMDSWVGRQMDEDINHFFKKEHWTDEEFQAIYARIKRKKIETWGTCDIQLIHAIEQAGLRAVPMQKRMEDSEMIVYCTPLPMDNAEADKLNIKGITYYIIDKLPGPMEINIAPNFPAEDRERLFWYSNQNRKCLLFINRAENPAITSIEDIILSEPYSVNKFNLLYKDFE